ncbi:MAG TPA: NAD(P)-dependent oxidoreductase [Stellaceae bacterium]|nr:NAD(P)-dependent oxidoreductase [Stellaceae bacterium]
MKPKVFVCQPIAEAVLEVLREAAEVGVYPYLDRQITQDELAANAARNDWLFLASDNIIPAALIETSPNLRGIGTVSRFGHYIDLKAATARKLPIVSADPDYASAPDLGPAARGGVSLATADLTVAMLLGLAYRLVEADRYTRAGHFKQEQTLALMGIGCPGKTVGVIGMGKVARYMIPRLRALDMTVIYTKRNRLAQEEERALGLRWSQSLDALLAESDFVCVACDYNPETHKLVGARELGLMKKTAFLINTARGRIVDESALIRALQEKAIAGAALDVFWNEPPVVYDPFVPEALRKLDNVILAPHNGGAVWEVRVSRAISVARGMIATMQGRRAPGLLNPEIYE